MRSNDIDIIHSHRSDADILVSHLDGLGIPIMTTIHGEHALTGRGNTHPLGKPLMLFKGKEFRKAISRFNLICTVCKSELRALHEWGIPSKIKTEIIYNGIDLKEILNYLTEPVEKKASLDILFPGGSKWYKGGDLAIRAFAKVLGEIPNMKLHFVGAVPENDQLRRLTSELQIDENVVFYGLLPRERYLRLLHTVDLVMMPSRREAFPMAIIEAMGLGKTIIASKAGGIPEVITEGRNGLLIDLTVDSVAKALKSLATDRGLRESIGRNNLLDVVKYDQSLMADHYLSLYRNIVRKNQ